MGHGGEMGVSPGSLAVLPPLSPLPRWQIGAMTRPSARPKPAAGSPPRRLFTLKVVADSSRSFTLRTLGSYRQLTSIDILYEEQDALHTRELGEERAVLCGWH